MRDQKYKINVVSTMEDFEGMADAWSALLEKSYSDTIFLTWEWLYTWAEYFMKGVSKLFIVTVSDGEELIGIAPWYIKTERYGPFRIRKVYFLGTPDAGSDYLDVIARKGVEQEVSGCLYDVLFREATSQWDVLYFSEVPSNSKFFLCFLFDLKINKKYYEFEEGAYCPIVKLPGSVDEFNKSLSPHRRYKYKRGWKILNQQGSAEFCKYIDIGWSRCIEDFKELYEKRWGQEYDSFFSFLSRFASRVIGRWTVSLDMLKVDGNYTGGLIHIDYKKVKYQYLMAIDTDFNKNISIGDMICEYCIQSAIEEKFMEYDFLKGNESHKLRWMNDGKRTMIVVHYKRHPGAIALATGKITKNMLKILLR